MKNIVITGVSTGIGYASTKNLINNGYRVFGSVRKTEDADKLTEDFGDIFIELTATYGEFLADTEFDLEVLPINDPPSFSDSGSIAIDEDEIYEQTWAYDISPGADNEDDDLV